MTPIDPARTAAPAVERVNQRRKTPWQVAARRLLQSEMAKQGFDYKSLARMLGEDENPQSLMTRINRGTFSFAFLLQAVRVMGTKSLDVSYLPREEGRTPGRLGG